MQHAPALVTPSLPALRTPDERFASLPGYPWAARYVEGLPSLRGLRLHYLDEGPRAAVRTWLCLHGNPTWSYLYRKMIPVFLSAGHRVVAPDMPGFGRSDKPIDDAAHSFAWHRSVLLELVEHLQLQDVNLVVQDWGGLIGLTLPMEAPWRYRALLVMNTILATADDLLPEGFLQWRKMCADRPDFSIGKLFDRGNPHLSEAECAAYDAPFPSSRFRAATRAFPGMVPERPDQEAALIARRAERFWREEWAGPSLMAVGAQDPVFTPAVMASLAGCIRGCPEPMQIPEGGHFVQEHGAVIAQEALCALG